MFLRPKIENKELDAQNAQRRTRHPTLLTMKTYIPTDDSENTFPTQKKKRGRGNKIMVGAVVKSKVGELEEEIREELLRRLRKEITATLRTIHTD